MNDLAKISVTYELPQIALNTAEIEAAIAELEEQYRGWIVVADDLHQAKKTVAELNKSAKAIEDKRIEMKKKISEPITAMENTLKALSKRINDLGNEIKAQTDGYEKKRVEDRTNEILAFPEWVAEYMAFDPKWTNITMTDKQIKEQMAMQKQFFTNNSLLIHTTCNAKGLKAEKYVGQLASGVAVAEIVASIENDAQVMMQYAQEARAVDSQIIVHTIEEETEVYDITLKLTATQPQLTALRKRIDELGIKYEVVD